KQQATEHLPLMKALPRQFYFFSFGTIQFKFLNQENGNDSYNDRQPYYAIHMKTLKPKHLLYAKPGNHLTFNQQYSKCNSYHTIFQIGPPGPLLFYRCI